MRATTAYQSLAMCGVLSKSVRTWRPAGADIVNAVCVRNGEALYASGADVGEALDRLATAAMLAAMAERGAA